MTSIEDKKCAGVFPAFLPFVKYKIVVYFKECSFFLMFKTPLSLVPYSCNLGSWDVLRT